MDMPPGDPSAGSKHSYSWTIPDAITDQARVRVRQDNSGVDYEDISDADFSIQSQASPDMAIIAIDMTQAEYPSVKGFAKGFTGDIPAIVFKDNLSGEKFLWIMTLDPKTGEQQGDRMELELGESTKPVDVLLSKHFLSSRNRGVDPTPFILFEDHSIMTMSLTFTENGTPIPGNILYIDPLVDPDNEGLATCFAEIPGLGFADDRPRLFIGTAWGNIVVLVNDPIDGVVLDYLLAASEFKPVPQYDLISMAFVSDGIIVGFSLDQLVGSFPGNGEENRHFHIYSLADPRPSPVTNFDIFGPTDEPLTDPDLPVKFVVANGTNELGLAFMSSLQEGDETLNFSYLDPVADPVSRVVSGSLLKLLADSSAAMYDPAYSEDTGSGDCEVNITDDVSDACQHVCGDANGDLAVNVGDAVFLISYIFKGGPPPDPVCLGDANGDGSADVGDAVYLIAYVFKGGAAPVEGCCF
jgi:hypothetical protein